MASTTRRADQPKPAGGLAERLLTSTSEAERRLGDLLQRFESIEPSTGPKLARLERKLAASVDPRDRQLLQVLYEIAEDRGVGPPEPVEIEATLELAGRSRAVPVRLTLVAGGESTTYRIVDDGSDESTAERPKKSPARRVRPKKAKAAPSEPPVLEEAHADAPPAPQPEPELPPIPGPDAIAVSPLVDEPETPADQGAALAEFPEAQDESGETTEPEVEVDAEERAELLKALMEADPSETVAEAPASPVALTFSEVAGGEEEEPIEDSFTALAGEPPSLLDEFEANAVAVDEPDTVEEPAPALVESASSDEIETSEPEPEREFSIADCDIDLVERVPRRIAFMALAMPFKRVDGKVQFLAADQIEASAVELLAGLVEAEVEIVTIDRQELLARLSAVYGTEPLDEREAILGPATERKPGLLKRLFGRKAA